MYLIEEAEKLKYEVIYHHHYDKCFRGRSVIFMIVFGSEVINYFNIEIYITMQII